MPGGVGSSDGSSGVAGITLIFARAAAADIAIDDYATPARYGERLLAPLLVSWRPSRCRYCCIVGGSSRRHTHWPSRHGTTNEW